MGAIPLLICGDAPSASTGLGRITRELCIRIHENLGETFRLGTYGLGGAVSRRFGFQQYTITKLEGWAPTDLPRVWRDFAGDERGIIMPIWNPSSLAWLAMPEKLPAGTLKDFLLSNPFDRWLYAPIDAEGPNGKMPKEVAEVCMNFDRTLFYTKWAAEMMDRSECPIAEPYEHLPHGTDTKIFYPRDRKEMRETFVRTVTGLEPPEPRPVHESIFLIGIVATNTARKDWDLGFQVCQELRNRGVNVVLWAHTDSFRKHWNLPALAEAYGMKDRVVFTNTDLTDEQMAEAHCACDVTLGIGRGEGWGLVESSSLACGVPVVTGGYAGAAEFVPLRMQVKPVAFEGEGWYGHRRPVFRVEDWADVVQAVAGTKTRLPEGLSWDECWSAWEKWFLEGVNGEESKTVSQDEIRKLNYDHHRRMTEEHNLRKAKESVSAPAGPTVENLDDASFRFLLADVPKGGAILELGSASGGQWGVLREWSDNLTGLDLYEPAVKASQEKGLNIVLGFVEALPFPDESFDLVCSRHVMEHVGDPQKALSEIKRVLKPGGYVAAVTPHRFPDPEPAHITQLRIQAWQGEYEKAEFDVLYADLRSFNCVEAHIVARKGTQ
jgi:SAM-dependent methyltransferase/glycosyltransferase involved in cell wall biosynthesis